MNMKQPDCSLLCVQRYLQNTRLDEARQMGLFSHAQPKSSWQKGGATKRGHSGYCQSVSVCQRLVCAVRPSVGCCQSVSQTSRFVCPLSVLPPTDSKAQIPNSERGGTLISFLKLRGGMPELPGTGGILLLITCCWPSLTFSFQVQSAACLLALLT